MEKTGGHSTCYAGDTGTTATSTASELDQAGNQIIIHADKLVPGDLILDTVTLFFFNDLTRFTSRVDGRTATLEPGDWLIEDGTRWLPNEPPEPFTELRLPTSLTPRKIEESFASPDTMSFWDLPGFIALLEAIRLSRQAPSAAFQRSARPPVSAVCDGARRRNVQPAHAAPRGAPT